jgi:hypothetical protein
LGHYAQLKIMGGGWLLYWHGDWVFEHLELGCFMSFGQND